MLKKKYDFIIPIGCNCLIAHNLRKNGLQRESLPFDWIWVANISQVITFLKTKFQNFMKKENLRFVRHNGDADIYRDTLTHVEHWHDFMIGETFDDSFTKNQKKYQRRIERMFHHIDCSKKILWVRFEHIRPDKQKDETDYLFQNAPESSENIIKNFSILQSLYPEKKSDLLLIRTWDQPRELKEYDMTPQIHVCEMYNDEALGWKGDEPAFKTILAPYGLTLKSRLYYFVNTFKYKMHKLGLKLTSLGSNALKKTSKSENRR